MKNCKLLAAAMVLLPATVAAQSDSISQGKIVTNAIMVGIGSTNILDTYLSPEKYRGTELRYISHTTREREDRLWSRQIVHQGDIAYADNRANEGGEIAGMYNFQYLWHRNWQFMGGRLKLKAGGGADANVGFIYNTRNGNNPAQARAYANAMASAAAEYRFTLLKHNAGVRYEVGAPLVGLMFSPNYGQSYYEIFTRGNYDHNIVPTTFICSPSLRQMLTMDFSIGNVALRIGYMGDYQQAKVNSLKSHIYTHAFVIGVVRHFKIIKLKP